MDTTHVSSGLTEVPDSSLKYIVPLCAFERLLLAEAKLFLDDAKDEQNCTLPLTVTMLFPYWTWAQRVQEHLRDDLEGETNVVEFHGNREMAYDGFIRDLSRGNLDETSSLARANQIRNTNEGFLARLGQLSPKSVKIVPAEEDLSFWETIARIVPQCSQFVKESKSMWDLHPTFDIVRLVRVYTILRTNQSNVHDIDRTLIASPEFMTIYQVKRDENPISSGSEPEASEEPVFSFAAQYPPIVIFRDSPTEPTTKVSALGSRCTLY
jgi:hypothetical protein